MGLCRFTVADTAIEDMIEFKAECGHTVRARDEDAGGRVRCSYCGRDADVPDQNDAGDLDFLFQDVEQQDAPAKRRRKKRKPKALRGGDLKPGGIDPFSIVLKVCYVTGLIVVCVVIARQWVMPLFEDGALANRSKSRQVNRTPKEKPTVRASKSTRAPAPGLIGRTGANGLYVASTPPGATVFVLELSKAPKVGRINEVQGAQKLAPGSGTMRLSDGSYVVEVAFPWNHSGFTDESLRDAANYVAFRKSVENASFERGVELMKGYFLPDEATNVFVDRAAGQIYLVRQYRDVVVRRGRSKGVRSIFLPKLKAEGLSTFLLEPLLQGYIPSKKNYSFDEALVRRELKYHDVASSDIRLVVEALSRIGEIPYVTADGRMRLFQIGIYDGEFRAPSIEELGE